MAANDLIAKLEEIRRELRKLEDELGDALEGGKEVGGIGDGLSGSEAGFGSDGGGFLSGGGGGDVIVPTVGQKVNPDGTVRYEFAGKVLAEGLVLPETSLASPPASDPAIVAWLDENGTIQEQIYGYEASFDRSYLYFVANPERNRSGGRVSLAALAGGEALAASARIELQSDDNGNRTVFAHAGVESKVIINQNESSDFPQLPSSSPPINRQIFWGRVERSGELEDGEGEVTSEKIEQGKYRINIIPALDSICTPIVTPLENAQQVWFRVPENNISDSHFVVEFFNAGLSREDCGFSFFGIG